MRILITGGCGFIGTALTDLLLRHGNTVLNFDKMTYAANPDGLHKWESSPAYRLVVGDVTNLDQVLPVFEEFQPDCVVHCAAETKRGRSATGSAQFLQTNFVGTFTLLEAARSYWSGRNGYQRFHMVSTDEVYGGLGPKEPAFTEDAPFRPANPYSASIAAAAHLVRAWGQSYGLPVVTTHSSNTFGPWQFLDRFVPLQITNGIRGRDLPIFGTGQNIRDWLHVEDHAKALMRVIEFGMPGESFNIGGSAEHTNNEVVELICTQLDTHFPENAPHLRQVRHVEDRSGNDWRSSVNTGKIRRELNWRPEVDLKTGIASTVEWYLANRSWWERIPENKTQGQRSRRCAA